MTKIIAVDQERCTGCRLCEMVCSLKKEGVSDPARSRIHIIKWEMDGFYLPMLCQHCDEPMCVAVCPVNAVCKDETTGLVKLNSDLCIGCRACVSVCPFGGVGFDSIDGKIVRCDLCDGDPACVKFCVTNAIEYCESELVHIRKKRSAAEKFFRVVKGSQSSD